MPHLSNCILIVPYVHQVCKIFFQFGAGTARFGLKKFMIDPIIGRTPSGCPLPEPPACQLKSTRSV